MVNAWFGTVWRVMLRPAPTFGGARDGGFGLADLGFAGICIAVGVFGQLTALVVLGSWVGLGFAPRDFGAVTMATLCLGIPFAFWWCLIQPSIDFVVLSLLGVRPRGWPTQLRASALSTAPLVLGILPFGLAVGILWALVVKVVAYRVFHAATWLAAVLTVVLVPVLGAALLLVLPG